MGVVLLSLLSVASAIGAGWFWAVAWAYYNEWDHMRAGIIVLFGMAASTTVLVPVFAVAAWAVWREPRCIAGE